MSSMDVDTDTAVAARRVFLDGRFVPATVTVVAGRVDRIGPFDPNAAYVLPEDQVLLPGLVDSHVHLNDPGRADWEGFASGTAAAAAGGIATVFDMPLNSVPVTTTPEALSLKRATARGKLAVDLGYWGGAVPENLGTLRSLGRAGVVGFKCFLLPSGIDEFGYLGAEQLRAALAEVAEFDGLMIVHAENAAHIHTAEALGPRYRDFVASRPPESERTAIAQVIEAARQTGARVHIVHLSAAEVLDDIRDAKAAGVRLTVETCPHYLTLRADEVPDGAGEFKCCPPLRGQDNQNALWAGVLDGTIDAIVSDHSPSTRALKEPADGDLGAAWGGIAGLQTGLSSVWTEAERRGIALEKIVPLFASGPAGIVGLSELGRIATGAPAHFTAFAPDAEWRVDAAALEYRNKLSPWHGALLRGRVERTYLRGELVYRRGEGVLARHGREVWPRGVSVLGETGDVLGERGDILAEAVEIPEALPSTMASNPTVETLADAAPGARVS